MSRSIRSRLCRRRGDAPPAAARVKVPTVLQLEAVECGAAALAMILGYHGRFVPLEEVRLACGVSRDGTKASSIVKAARTYGLVARGFTMEPAGLRGLPLPQIVFWDFNHFVVVEGFGPDRVYLNDPVGGPRRVTGDEFDQSFTGVVLTFEPGPTFRVGGERQNTLAGLRRRLRGAIWPLVGVLLLTLALVVPALAVPALTRHLVDRYFLDGAPAPDLPALVAFGGVALLNGAAIWAQRAALLRLELRLLRESAGAFVRHLLRLPLAFFTQRHAGELGGRVHLNDTIARLLAGELATTCFSLILLAFYAALMVIYDPPLAALALACAALNLLALRAMARRRAEGSQRLLQEAARLGSTTVSGLQLIETLKGTGGEEAFFTRWSGQQARLANARQDLAATTRALGVVPAALGSLASVAVLAVGAGQVMSGALTVGTLVAFQGLLVGFLGPTVRLIRFGGLLQEIGGSLARLDDVQRYPPDSRALLPLPTEGAIRTAGRLELRSITFGYSRLDPPLLADFSLTVAPGQRIAIVGGSGSGKSTVARLAAGLLAPWSGEVLLDEHPLACRAPAALAGALALVDQEIALFGGTVRDNLTLWDTTIPEARIVAAARDACLHEELLARPGGYDATVDEGGRNFSGGQRQRLELARALVAEPALVILDEATSALDPPTEEAIVARLRRRGCACLIVAHRLSTIRDCDEIIVLDRGRIVQRGTHEALLRVGGLYARLITAE